MNNSSLDELDLDIQGLHHLPPSDSMLFRSDTAQSQQDLGQVELPRRWVAAGPPDATRRPWQLSIQVPRSTGRHLIPRSYGFEPLPSPPPLAVF